MKKYLTNSSLETQKIAEDFSKNLNGGDVVLLFGDLGAGKTTFVQGIAKGLRITERILSPTFVLIRNHDVSSSKFETLNHIDLYRIDEPAQIEKLGLSEFISENSVTLIEWAEKLLDFKPKKGYKIRLSHLGEDKREIEISKI